LKAAAIASEKTASRYHKPWQLIDFIFQNSNDGKIYYECLSKLHAFTAEIILKRMEERKSNKENENTKPQRPYSDFLDVLMK